jgi:putative membrane protein
MSMRCRVALATICAAAGAVPAATNAKGSTDAGAETTPVTGAGGQLTDTRIAAIAVTANKVDIEAGRLAMRKSRNVAVKNFASDMISDHTSANKQAAALAQKLGLSPEANDFSRSLAQGGQDNLANLKPLTGKEFDLAYAEHEVVYHQQVLAALKEKLIPSAQNAELKSLLESVRTLVAAHLDHAQELYESLSK